MAHGTRDWGLVGPKVTTYGLDDLGEHAVRLGSIVSFDRRGDVIWMDDFEEGTAKWRLQAIGAGAALVLDCTYARSSPFCLKITTPSDFDFHITPYFDLPVPVLGRIGVEASFANQLGLADFEIRGTFYTAAWTYQYYLRYRFQENDLAIQDNTPAYVIVQDNLNLFAGPNVFHTMKLVFDVLNHTYVSYIIDSFSGDLIAYLPNRAVAGADRYLQIGLRVTGENLQNRIMRIDDVIVTQNEP